MFKGFGFVVLIMLLLQQHAFAQGDTAAKQADIAVQNSKNLRMSLVICGLGDNSWQTFGHCAIRIIDNTRDSAGRDVTYNYGIFGMFDGSMQKQFLQGRIRVYLDVVPFPMFMNEYVVEGREVYERELQFEEAEKERIQAYLDSNALPENRYYNYDFIYDNCTVRLGQVFPNALGAGFDFGKVIPPGSHVTFHDLYQAYYHNKYWYGMLTHLFFVRSNVAVSNEQSMFLPFTLEKGIVGATYNGSKIAGPRVMLLESHQPPPGGVNMPLIISWLLAAATVLGLCVPRLRLFGRVMSIFFLLLSSLVGIAILYAWFGTSYPMCRNNANLLWALPFNFVLLFLPGRAQFIYSFVTMCLICVALLLHILGMQILPLAELLPVWIALFAIYGATYRRSRLKNIVTEHPKE